MDEEIDSIIDEYYKMIYGIAYNYLKCKDDVEDIVQELFIKYINYTYKNGKFLDKNYEKYWLIRITINMCLNELKTSKRKNESILENRHLKYEYDLEEISILDSIDKLGDKYKVIVNLHYIQDLKIEEISKILNISVSAVKTRLKRARNKLKKLTGIGDD